MADFLDPVVQGQATVVEVLGLGGKVAVGRQQALAVVHRGGL
jgi:hypothetical protein